jgi:hypothetical protein
MMKRGIVEGWLSVGCGVVLLCLWGYARTDWDHMARLELALHGLPFAELREEAPGARQPHADGFGLAYRRSVYSRGGYVGCIKRFGAFIRPGEAVGNPFPFLLVELLDEWGQYGSALLAVVGFLEVLRSKQKAPSQPPAAGDA